MIARWRRLLLSDWQLKLGGLATAAVLWAYVHQEQTLQLTLTIPLELRNPPRAMRYVRRPPATVEVRLVAPRDVIPRLEPRSVRAVVDLTGQVTGRHASVDLGPDHIVRPPGVAVAAVTPAQLVLDFVPAAE